MTQAQSPTVESDRNEFSAIGFTVGPEEYGLPLASVKEIIATPRITRVPKAPAHVAGVINLHGNVIPVIDVARRFGIGSTFANAVERVVVVEAHDEVVGILANSVSKVSRFQHTAMQPPPPLVAGIAAEYMTGVIRQPGRFLIFLALERLLEDDWADEGIAEQS